MTFQAGGAAVGSIIGAIIGTIILPGVGTAIGGAIGGALGGLAGGAIDYEMSDPVHGPRLSDLNVSTSTYGNPIPRIWGTVRLPGNMVWSTGLIEIADEGGKGGKEPKTVTYTYFASFRHVFCAGPAEAITRIWLDTKLAYDATGANEAVEITGLKITGGIRIYLGGEDQLPDAAEIAHLGEGNATAYRGRVSIVIERLPLQGFFNRIPNVTAEIAMNATSPAIVLPIINLAGSPSAQGDRFAVDWPTRRGYRVLADPTPSNILSTYDISAMQEDRRVTATDVWGGTPEPGDDTFGTIAAGVGGEIFVTISARPGCSLAKLDGQTLIRIGDVYAEANNSGPNRPDRLPLVDQMVLQLITGTDALGAQVTRTIVCCGVLLGEVHFIDGDRMQYLWGGTDTPVLDAPALRYAPDVDGVTIIVPGARRTQESDVWLFHGRDATDPVGEWDVWRVAIGAGAEYNDGTFITSDISAERVAILTGAMMTPGSTNFMVNLVNIDPSDNGFLIHCAGVGGSGGARLVKWHLDDGVIWAITDPNPPAVTRGSHGGVAFEGSTYYGWGNGNAYTMIDSRTGTLVRQHTITTADAAGLVWHARSRSLLIQGEGTNQRIFLDRVEAGTTPLSQVVSDICAGAGMEPGDVDADDLDAEVVGFAVGLQTGRDAITQLAAAYSFDGYEAGEALRFRHRGTPAVATIAYDDLVRADIGSDAPLIPLRRAQEAEIPRRAVLRFRDPARDQQINAVQWSRPHSPVPAVSSTGEQSLDLSAMVLPADQAKAIVRRLLMSRWSERTTIEKFTLTSKSLALEPTDAVMLTFRDGSTKRARLDRVDIGADWLMNITAVIEEGAVYDLPHTAPVDGGQGFPPQVIEGPYATRLFWPELPLLRDTDDLGGTGMRQYASAGGFPGQNFRGAQLWYSADAAAWLPIAAFLQSATWGVALGALGAPTSPWVTDTVNSVTVSMRRNGERLEGITTLQLLNGGNPAVLITAAGKAELIQFRDVTANVDGTYTLSRFLRGRRGTDWACGLHSAGDVFVLLDIAGWERFDLPLSDLGLPRSARLAGRFDVFDSLPLLSRLPAGEAEKPYSPVHVRGARDGSGNLTVTWVRRSRIGGSWRDLVGVPLSEASEAYAVDILDAGVVVRTITGLTTPTASYSAAEQTTDFGSAQAAIDLAVYQISATVGRGRGRSATV